MAVRFYDKIYVRAAGTQFTTIAKAALASDFALVPAGCKVTQELNLKTEPDVTTAMGDGTDNIGSEAASAELQLINFSGANLSSIRSEFVNKAVDLVVYDSRSDTVGWALFGVQLYPTPDVSGGKEPMIKLSGKKRYASDMSPALTMVTLS
ncbi:MAG: hypothetical protein PHY48_12750 [Candidatus Cloacimonetes bacterium]|nr:hypothetical protein [Candidatus Cloacimonadota bacterium]MDD2230267.1 hypothetical protein [Candidatus Cloacimonadota bacterium]